MSTSPGHKESELASAVLLYAMRCLEEGDHTALQSLNIGPNEVAALRELQLSDLLQLQQWPFHGIDIQIQRDVFWYLLERLRSARGHAQLKRQLIAADAPLVMMTALFGMGSREFRRLRQYAITDRAGGRSPEPDEQASGRLWHAWQACRRQRPGGILRPQDYLALSDEVGVSLRGIWQLTQRWTAEDSASA